MTDTKTIRRNTKLGKRILTAPVRVCAYSLSNEFSGAEVEIERFVKMIAADLASGFFSMSIRTTSREGWYTVQFHSNRWYEVRVEA